MKKNIVIFIDGYLPAQKYGGPVTSIVNLVDNLKEKYNFYIISNEHDLNEKTRLKGIAKGWNDVRGAKVLYINEKEYTKSNFIDFLKGINISLIYLSSVFSYKMNFPAISVAKFMNIPVLLAPRGEICEGAMKNKGLKKSVFLRSINILGVFNEIYFHTTSTDEIEGVKKYFKSPYKRTFLLPNLHGLKIEKKNLHKEPGEIKVLFISRIQEKKNLLYAIDVISKLSGKKIIFDIYGPIEQPDYWKKCEDLIEKVNKSIEIKYKGTLTPQESKEVYQNYNCFIFPTLSENYGHVIAESLLSSCPCIISKGTTPWDDVNGNGGFAISLNKKDEFVRALNSIVDMDSYQYQELVGKLSEYTNSKLNINELSLKYEEMFETVISNQEADLS